MIEGFPIFASKQALVIGGRRSARSGGQAKPRRLQEGSAVEQHSRSRGCRRPDQLRGSLAFTAGLGAREQRSRAWFDRGILFARQMPP